MAKNQSPGFAEESIELSADPFADRWVLKVGGDGRIVIPAAARSAMLLDSPGRVTALLEDGELRLVSPRIAIAKLQKLVKERDKGTGSAADELIAERRAEAMKE